MSLLTKWRGRRSQGVGPVEVVPAETEKVEYLSRINVFDELSKDELEELGRRTEMRTVKRGTEIMSPERPVNALFMLKEGRVRLYRLNADGRQFTLAMLGDGHIFGEIEVFSLRTRDMYAEAYDDSLLCILRRPDLEYMISLKPSLAMKLLHVVSDRLRDVQEATTQFALGTVRTRLLGLLVKLSEEFGVQEGDKCRLDLAITHQELANMVGSTRETVTATLSQLVQEGVVETGRKQITLDVEQARSMTEL